MKVSCEEFTCECCGDRTGEPVPFVRIPGSVPVRHGVACQPCFGAIADRFRGEVAK